ncbi:hypothetical protein DT73_01430 [Mangrovibacter sp. MFB070]|nr:hypothetical protein DT73_01430 [Mangrovibacter sp. MFB070]
MAVHCHCLLSPPRIQLHAISKARGLVTKTKATLLRICSTRLEVSNTVQNRLPDDISRARRFIPTSPPKSKTKMRYLACAFLCCFVTKQQHREPDQKTTGNLLKV